MRDAGNIQIEEIILHILDPIRSDGRDNLGFVPSRHPLPLDGNQVVSAYFTRHIERSLRSASAKAAIFRHIDENEISGVCAGLLERKIPLVEGSIQIARVLYDILDNDQRTSPGDLAVGFYQASNYPHERFLALLKIDPSQVFRHHVVETAEGNIVNFTEVPAAFTDKELQKCAFVRPLVPRHDDYDMILLDRLVDVSQYFKYDLLDSEERYGTRERTQKLYQALTAAHNQLRGTLSDQQNAALDAQKVALFTARRTNVDTWLDQLDLPNEIKTEIDLQIRRRLPDREFNLDTDFGQRLVERHYFTGDYGLKVQFEAVHYDDVIESEEPIMDDAGNVIGRRVVLHALNWREIAR